MMRSACNRRRWPAAASLALVATFLGAPVMATRQTPASAADVAVTAALLYNFAKFAEWPGLADSATLVACVVGDSPIAEALTHIVRGKEVGGHRFDVVQPTDGATWGDCHLLFIADGQASRAGAGLAGIRSLPVLTASEDKGFSRSGGIVEFYLDAGKMRFVINLDAAERSGLRLSSRLLGLATVIRDRDVR